MDGCSLANRRLISRMLEVMPVYVVCTGDPDPEKEIGAETSDDEDAPVTCNDESFAAIAAIRIGY